MRIKSPRAESLFDSMWQLALSDPLPRFLVKIICTTIPDFYHVVFATDDVLHSGCSTVVMLPKRRSVCVRLTASHPSTLGNTLRQASLLPHLNITIFLCSSDQIYYPC